MPFEFNTERELRIIQRLFGHSSVKATEEFFRRAKGSDLDRDTREVVIKIAEG